MQNQPTKKDLVYQQIRRSILAGELKPGEILNEGELARKYGFGKTPTREALIVLSHERFIEPLPRVGYVVAKTSVRDVLETFQLRALLEVEAVGLAVERITDRDIQRLESNNLEEKEIFNALSGDDLREKAYWLNRDFHSIIAAASGNSRLAALVLQLIDDMERMLVIDPSLADSSQHAAILARLKARDRSAAQAALRQHLDETRSRILNLV